MSDEKLKKALWEAGELSKMGRAAVYAKCLFVVGAFFWFPIGSIAWIYKARTSRQKAIAVSVREFIDSSSCFVCFLHLTLFIHLWNVYFRVLGAFGNNRDACSKERMVPAQLAPEADAQVFSCLRRWLVSGDRSTGGIRHGPPRHCTLFTGPLGLRCTQQHHE